MSFHDEGTEAKVGGRNERGEQPARRLGAARRRRESSGGAAAALFCMITCLIYLASQKLWAMTEPI